MFVGQYVGRVECQNAMRDGRAYAMPARAPRGTMPSSKTSRHAHTNASQTPKYGSGVHGGMRVGRGR